MKRMFFILLCISIILNLYILTNTNNSVMVYSNIDDNYLVLVNKYNGLDSNYEPNDLEEITSSFNKGLNNRLRHDAKVSFEEMCSAALLDNIYLYSMSSYRAYGTQEYIYNKGIEENGIVETEKTTARPGYSEHQLGLAVDINWISIKFEETSEYNWLINNSYKYGFILRYPKDMEDITLYSYEPWHYRYVGKEVAFRIYNDNITFDEYYNKYLS